MIRAVLPWLGMRQAAAVSLGSNAVASTLPAGGAFAVGVSWAMLSSWGLSTGDYVLYTLVTGIWNLFTLMGLPVLAVLVMATASRPGATMITGAAVGLALPAVMAGGLGFLASGYLSADQTRERIGALRALTARPFGVNLFVPGHGPADPATYEQYTSRLSEWAEREGLELGEPRYSEDDWEAKLELLRVDPVPVVSFTFGCPDRDVIESLRSAGSEVWVTVTSPAEARMAAERGVHPRQMGDAGDDRRRALSGAHVGEHRLARPALRRTRTLQLRLGDAARHRAHRGLHAAGAADVHDACEVDRGQQRHRAGAVGEGDAIHVAE